MTVLDQIERARALLVVATPPVPRPLHALGSAALAAVSAVLMAGVVVLGPGADVVRYFAAGASADAGAISGNVIR